MSAEFTKRPPWSEVRALLEREGFHPSKSLGQNFLVDANMARAIARDAQVGPGQHVLEVGPGCASLSLELAALGVDLTAVEIDDRLARIARQVLVAYPEARIVESDVLARKNRLAPAVLEILEGWGSEPWHLAANLPYSISGPVLVLLSRCPSPPRSATVLVQREVADRIAAAPGTPEYGPLGLKMAPLFGAQCLRNVPAGLFWPKPRVESTVLRLERRAADPGSLEAFDRLVDGLFQRRRKTLLAGLGAHLSSPKRARMALEGAGLDPMVRAETLPWEDLWRLERALAAFS